MFHISDIEKRLRDNPEPPEVKAIRENILTTFNKLEFVEEGHKYFLPRADGTKEELISVSGMVEQFIPYVDWDTACKNKSIKLGVTQAELKRSWRENNIRATNSGSLHHRFGEMYQYFYMGHPAMIDEVIRPQYEDGFLIPSCPKQEAVCRFYEDIAKATTIYPVLAETRVYMGVNDMFRLKQKFAGTFDMLFAYKSRRNEWELMIYDFKTNSALANDVSRALNKRMLPPFDDLIDENFGHYTLQLSAYELALRQLGYKIADRKLIWLKNDGNYEKYSLPSYSDRLAKFL